MGCYRPIDTRIGMHRSTQAGLDETAGGASFKSLYLKRPSKREKLGGASCGALVTAQRLLTSDLVLPTFICRPHASTGSPTKQVLLQ